MGQIFKATRRIAIQGDHIPDFSLKQSSTLYNKMKIFFALALVIFVNWSVVLSDVVGNFLCGTFLGGNSIGDLSGSSKRFSYPGEGIEKCEQACLDRSGCTGFEYNHGGDEGYKCGTYTGGMSDVQEGSQSSSWTSCVHTSCMFGAC